MSKLSLKSSQTAMMHIKEIILNQLKHGIILKVQSGVPLYHADPRNPQHIIRNIDGCLTSGSFSTGKFVPIKE